MKCFGTCQMLRGLWKDISGLDAETHMRTDADNLVSTASTTHSPRAAGNHSHDSNAEEGSLLWGYC